MMILGPILVLISFVGLVSFYWYRLANEERAYNRRWYFTWLGKGLVLPIVVWFLLNVGRTPVMPPIVKVEPLRNIGQPPTIIYPDASMPNAAPIIVPGKPKYVGVGPAANVAIQTAAALVSISSFWSALTFIWFARVMAARASDRKEFQIGGAVWFTLMFPFGLWIMWAWGLGGAGFALTLCFAPVVHCLTALDPYRNPLPRYTAAIVKIKFGKYAEAERAIIKELEKSENDFDGWLMLAELYARQFGDLDEAERTVLELCDDPDASLSQKSIALHKLADWQLQFRGDPNAAGRALQGIVDRMPGTHLARMAKLRLQQLPATRQEWTAQQAGKKFKMPALNDDLENATKELRPDADPAEAEQAANQCVEKLYADPKDIAAREKLARIFAERLGEVELGLEQLELLIEMPEQSPNKAAEWLGLMAAWQIRYRQDREAAQKTLLKLVRNFPNSAQAFAAQRRLKLMEMEML